MKILKTNNALYKAEKIYKGKDSIIGYDSNNGVNFEFKGIVNFDLFEVEGGYDSKEAQGLTNEQLTLELSSTQMALSDVYEELVRLQEELNVIKGGNSNG